jgi:hypothetical protein
MIKKIVIIVLLLCTVPVFLLAYQLWQNNRSVSPVNAEEIRQSRERAVSWLLKNREAVLNENNSILWWMIRESGLLTDDERLKKLSDEYIARLAEMTRNKSPWLYFFDESISIPVTAEQLAHLPDYNRHFLYGLTCSEELAALETIQQQNQTDFCWKTHPLSPACVTHQLMAFRFMQRKSCRNPENIADAIARLQDYIVWQLIFDFRVVDVYIQRVLMLIDSGAVDRVKPVWLKRVIASQLDDGGWSGFNPVIRLGRIRYLGFSGRGVSLGSLKSSFHTTAQGILLTSYLLQRFQDKPLAQK